MNHNLETCLYARASIILSMTLLQHAGIVQIPACSYPSAEGNSKASIVRFIHLLERASADKPHAACNKAMHCNCIRIFPQSPAAIPGQIAVFYILKAAARADVKSTTQHTLISCLICLPYGLSSASAFCLLWGPTLEDVQAGAVLD